MAHSHAPDPVVHHDRQVIDRGGGTGAGMLIAVAALIAIVVIGLAVLWAAPWDDDGGNTPNIPDVTDNSGGGVDVPVPDGGAVDVPGVGGEGDPVQ